VAGDWRLTGGSVAWRWRVAAEHDGAMNTTRIIELRQAKGWTQERLATESGVGLRTVQRLEAGEDASLETLSLVAEALHVPVRDLFSTIEDASLSSRVDSLADRTSEQQTARDRLADAWTMLFVGIGVVVTLLSFTVSFGLAIILSYWIGGFLILRAVRRIWVEPRLDATYPLSRPTESRRTRRRLRRLEAERSASTPVALDATPAPTPTADAPH
jgi:transcriptional regulator with XRE-family HTH domain